MPDHSAILSLPYLQPAQAQKHVTHNEALRLLDKIVQLVVQDRDRSDPPAAPTEGDAHIVAAPGINAWAGHDAEIAVWEDDDWTFVSPRAGWTAQVLSEAQPMVYTASSGWQPVSHGDLDVTRLGINTQADAINRLAVASPASLFSHEGAGHQVKLNKAAAADTGTLLFQTDWSGRAEVGTAGSDDFVIKVSPDGAGWKNALSIDSATALATFPEGLDVAGQIGGTAVQSDPIDTTPGRLMPVGAFGLGQTGTGPTALLADMTTTGFFAYSLSDPDRPTQFGGAVQVVRYASNWVTQLAMNPVKSEIFHRRSSDNGATWTDWFRLYTQATVLGAVSQSGGTPTGALIETGSETEGDFMRLADGTQRCTHRVTVPGTGSAAWTFPRAFADSSAVISALAVDALPRIATVSSISATDVQVHLFDLSGAAIGGEVALTATGRWF